MKKEEWVNEKKGTKKGFGGELELQTGSYEKWIAFCVAMMICCWVNAVSTGYIMR